MSTQDQDRHDVEEIIRRAEEMGHDPARVARALDHPRREQPAVKQATTDDAARVG